MYKLIISDTFSNKKKISYSTQKTITDVSHTQKYTQKTQHDLI